MSPSTKTRLTWALTAVVMVVVFLATYPLALVLPGFVIYRQGKLDNNTRTGEGYYLPDWLSWFQTPDNSIDGDKGWREEHMQWRFKFPEPVATYLGRVGWLWRNPAYGVGLAELVPYERVLLVSGDLNVGIDPVKEGSCLVETQDGRLFLHRKVSVVKGFAFYRNYGWNIKGLVNNPEPSYTATFALSVRVKKV